jgi:flavin reductase (DIM6/NTAB) family NADH-FMN oxidoreductase RutF
MRQVSISEAFKRKYPEQIVLAVSVDGAGTPDIITLGWAMPTSNQPPMVAISVGHTRYSHELISADREYVLAFPGPQLAEACLFCGTKSGREVEKVRELGLATFPAKLVRPPLLGGCVACFEVKVTGELVTGDHTIFAGEVVAAHVDDSVPGRVYNFAGKFLPASPAG